MDDSIQSQARQVDRRIKNLLNTQLKDLCKKEGLAVSGVKAVLQTRLLERASISSLLGRIKDLNGALGLLLMDLQV